MPSSNYSLVEVISLSTVLTTVFQDSSLFVGLGPDEYWPTIRDNKGCESVNNSRYDSLELIEPTDLYQFLERRSNMLLTLRDR